MWVTGTGHGACTYEKILNNVYNIIFFNPGQFPNK